MSEEKKVMKDIGEKIRLLKEVFPEVNVEELVVSTIASTMVEREACLKRVEEVARQLAMEARAERRLLLALVSKLLRVITEALEEAGK